MPATWRQRSLLIPVCLSCPEHLTPLPWLHGQMPWQASSQDSHVHSCLCIYHACTSSFSSSTTCHKVHKHTLSPLHCGALFFTIKVTLKRGSLHQKACVSCCSWFIARRPQQAILLHASQPTESLLSAYLQSLSNKFHKLAHKTQLNEMPRSIWTSDV